jgi:hypothetical protein
VLDFTPLTTPPKEHSGVDLHYVLRANRLGIVEPEPHGVVTSKYLSFGRDDTIVTINEKTRSFVETGRPTSGAVRLKAKEGKGEIGPHHLPVCHSSIAALDPQKRAKRTLRQQTKATRYLYRSKERGVKNRLRHRVVETVRCTNQINRGLVTADTDRCNPFIGRRSAKKPVGPPEAGVKALVKRAKKVHSLIVDDEWSSLPRGLNFFVPRREQGANLLFLKTRGNEFLPSASPKLIGTRAFRLTRG